MRGTLTVPFSSLFNDTIAEHGMAFAFQHYVVKHGMAFWEWRVWLKGYRLSLVKEL